MTSPATTDFCAYANKLPKFASTGDAEKDWALSGRSLAFSAKRTKALKDTTLYRARPQKAVRHSSCVCVCVCVCVYCCCDQ